MDLIFVVLFYESNRRGGLNINNDPERLPYFDLQSWRHFYLGLSKTMSVRWVIAGGLFGKPIKNISRWYQRVVIAC